MLVGQQLGPFLIDKELGSGAMGTVYRARYTKTGQVVAIKVMSPGVGTTNASALGRFEREAEILKQLNHPNIVRIFGVGKAQGMRYLAMEYIDGDSLDHVMARRDRMTWEEVVDLGQQLCAALQHAHEKGIVHRDLKPSNLMILRDGTLKLADFGIAKDLDETGLTATNCTIGTAAYMSPEQCRGERSLTYKSDLYSLGIVFYELITGKKPFRTENALEMFMMHCNGTFERPSRLVLGLPVWMDTLICQLMEKTPEQRPLDAAMVGTVLAGIQEKMEAQQSAGVALARARRGDLPKEQRVLAEEDREAARALSGKKRKKKPKKPKEGIPAWIQAIGLLVGLLVVIGLLVFALQPPSADTLYRQADRLMSSSKPEEAQKPIKEYLARFGKTPGPQTEQVRRWSDDYDIQQAEKMLERHLQHEKTQRGIKVAINNEAEELAFQAGLAEYDGDRVKARQLWQDVLKKWPGVPPRENPLRVDLLAQRHLANLEEMDSTEARLQKLFSEIDKGREPILEGVEQQVFKALRYERFGDLLRARQRFEDIKEETLKDPAQRFWFLFAAIKSHKLKKQLADMPQNDKTRKELLASTLEAYKVSLNRGASLIDLYNACLNILALYEKDPELADEVKQTRELMKEIARLLGKK